VTLQRDDDRALLTYKDGTIFGELDDQTKKALSGIRSFVECDTYAPTKPIYEVLGKGAKEVVVRVNIDIYGFQEFGKEVGGSLAKNKVYLQKPNFLRAGVPYENPHVLVLPGYTSQTNPSPLDTIVTEKNDATEEPSFQETMEDIFSHLTRDQDLAGINGDTNLGSRLFFHQQKALQYMLERENGPIPDTYSLWKTHQEHGVAWYVKSKMFRIC
jgi:SWI/SNF-related matrix-associated actin-dependent regulator of chromatin subfamily A3